MPIEQRNYHLQTLVLALGTLKTAISTINTGEGIKGCEEPTANAKAIARKQLARMRKALDEMETII